MLTELSTIEAIQRGETMIRFNSQTDNVFGYDANSSTGCLADLSVFESLQNSQHERFRQQNTTDVFVDNRGWSDDMTAKEFRNHALEQLRGVYKGIQEKERSLLTEVNQFKDGGMYISGADYMTWGMRILAKAGAPSVPLKFQSKNEISQYWAKFGTFVQSLYGKIKKELEQEAGRIKSMSDADIASMAESFAKTNPFSASRVDKPSKSHIEGWSTKYITISPSWYIDSVPSIATNHH